MLRENLIRGGIFVLVAVMLSTPVALAAEQLRPALKDGAEISAGAVQDPGWIGWFLEALRSLLGAEEGGGDIDPNGQPQPVGTTCTSGSGCSTSEGGTTTTTVSSGSLEVLGVG